MYAFVPLFGETRWRQIGVAVLFNAATILIAPGLWLDYAPASCRRRALLLLAGVLLGQGATSLSSPAVTHLHPTAELAERALLPDDPGQALALTRVLFDETPRMFNHHRGLWGYSGIALDGAPLTVQSTGIGGPSAAIVVAELHALGLRRAVRIGRAWALDGALRAGELVAATAVLAADGASRALGAGARSSPTGRSPRRCAATARACSRRPTSSRRDAAGTRWPSTSRARRCSPRRRARASARRAWSRSRGRSIPTTSPSAWGRGALPAMAPCSRAGDRRVTARARASWSLAPRPPARASQARAWASTCAAR